MSKFEVPENFNLPKLRLLLMKLSLSTLTCYILVLLSNPLFSQNMMSTDNKWSVTTNTWWQGLNTRTTVLRLDEPNILNGTQYQRVLESTDSLNLNWTYSNFYLRQDSTSKVFLLQNGEERILYDFKLVVGDTFEIFEYCNLIVTSVDSVQLLNNSLRKRITLETIEENNQQPVYWIEGIGNEQGLLSYFTCGASNSFNELICFKENEELLYPLDSENCFVFVTNSFEPFDNIIKVFPSIVDQNINIVLSNIYENTKIEVVSISGKVVFESFMRNKENMFNLSSLSNGIYFLRILNDSKIIHIEKFIKN